MRLLDFFRKNQPQSTIVSNVHNGNEQPEIPKEVFVEDNEPQDQPPTICSDFEEVCRRLPECGRSRKQGCAFPSPCRAVSIQPTFIPQRACPKDTTPPPNLPSLRPFDCRYGRGIS